MGPWRWIQEHLPDAPVLKCFARMNESLLSSPAECHEKQKSMLEMLADWVHHEHGKRLVSGHTRHNVCAAHAYHPGRLDPVELIELVMGDQLRVHDVEVQDWFNRAGLVLNYTIKGDGSRYYNQYTIHMQPISMLPFAINDRYHWLPNIPIILAVERMWLTVNDSPNACYFYRLYDEICACVQDALAIPMTSSSKVDAMLRDRSRVKRPKFRPSIVEYTRRYV